MNVMMDKKVRIEGESVHHECDDGQKSRDRGRKCPS